MNDTIRKQVALKDERKIAPLIGMAFIAAVHFPAVLLLLHDPLWRNFFLLGPTDPSTQSDIWRVVFGVAITDCLARYASVIAKVGVLQKKKMCL